MFSTIVTVLSILLSCFDVIIFFHCGLMQVEKTMFESASSRKNYYELLAHKIYSIKKELDDRKKIKQSKDI